ncbi:hypothetical protein RCL1_003443 [Eukaryota sp. TZLM3-RCL]
MIRCLVLVAFLLSLTLATTNIPYPKCTANQYFDSTVFSCVNCPANSIGDQFSCKCLQGFASIQSPSGSLTCLSCLEDDKVTSPDGSHCVSCNSNIVNNQCTCNLLTEYLSLDGDTLSCVPCPLNTARAPNSSPSSPCLPCTSLGGGRVIAQSSCQCPSGGEFAFDGCVTQSELTTTLSRYSSYSRLFFRDTTSVQHIQVDSALVKDIFRQAFIRCNHWVSDQSKMIGDVSSGGRRACQTLVNLCSLTLYDLDSLLCKSITDITSQLSGTTHSQREWSTGFPFYLYAESSAALRESNIYPVLEKGESLRFKVALYSLFGKFLGFFDGMELISCPIFSTAESLLNGKNLWENFGSNSKIKCSFKVNDLIEQSKVPIFAELYIDNHDNLIAVPVRVLNTHIAGTRPSAFDSDLLSLDFSMSGVVPGTFNPSSPHPDVVLGRRFLLWDAVSSRSLLSEAPRVVRFVTKMDLNIRANILTSSARVLPPILSIAYKEVTVPSIENPRPIIFDEILTDDVVTRQFSIPSTFSFDFSSNSSLGTFSFSSSFVSDSDGFRSLIIGLLWSLAALCFARFLVYIYAYSKRHPGETLSGGFLSFSLSSLSELVNHYFGLFLIFISFVYLIIFQFQGTIVLLLPSEASFEFIYSIFRIVIISGFIRIILITVSESFADVFLIDWEPINSDGNISGWRSVYVAKLWANLLSKRQYSPTILCCGLYLITSWFNFESFAMGNNLDPSGIFSQSSPILFLGMISLSYAICCITILIFSWPFQRWIRPGTLHRFLDLLPLTNISILSLDEPFSGMYIHGRSVSSKSDVSTSNLASLLASESRGTLPKRGLMVNIKDLPTEAAVQQSHQIFEVFLNTNDRVNFDRLWAATARARARALRFSSAVIRREDRPVRELSTFERLGASITKANSTMINWIDSLSSDGHIVTQSRIEKWINLPPPINSRSTSILTVGSELVVKSRSFLGKTLDFAVFEICTITWFYYSFGLFPALILCFLISHLSQIIKNFLGIISVAHHTLPLSELASA